MTTRAGKAGRFVIVVAGEPREEQVFEVKRRTKDGLEGTIVRNGFTALIYLDEVTRNATKAEIEVAKEIGMKNRPKCAICQSPMVAHKGLFGLMPWQCETHGESVPDSLKDGEKP